jgi:cytochrome P450/deferrochelatase/peroxidase EfeB
MTDLANATPEQTRKNVQAHILRAAKFKKIGGEPIPRNWSLFFFFRILPQAEFGKMMERMRGVVGDQTDDKKKQLLWQDFAQPALVNAGLVDQLVTYGPAPGKTSADPGAASAVASDAPPKASKDDASSAAPSEPDAPAKAFLAWLKAVVSADKSGIQNTADQILNLPKSGDGPQPVTPNLNWADPIGWMRQQFELKSLNIGSLQDFVGTYKKPDEFAAHLQSLQVKVLQDKAGTDDRVDGFGPLAIVTLYEALRQAAPAMLNLADSGEPAPAIIRGEEAHDPKTTSPIKDDTPINIAFTYQGLVALKMNDATLKSFPDAFKQGMAARAQRLHDTGPSAPDCWEGELGLPSVHGYFTGGFALTEGNPTKESFWKAMRADVEAFNEPATSQGQVLRFGFRMLFRLFGLEILHIELGQYPYEVDDDGKVRDLDHRFEHFGFRDGLSQPFVDLGLGDTAPGGGTASRDQTWIPVAPGEIFLDQPDEGGEVQLLPINNDLTVGSTFLVFRKLEQDVVKFRGFLSRTRPNDPKAQRALSAQFVGRWPLGAPLVLSPDHERTFEEARLNAFRYVADDPIGEKCPLGAHIRRANPRDIGGRNEARHHRILRRGISYGGPLLKDDAPDNGERRGLLFIAANSRIDLQFEVIQADWINGGEFLGQAGLGRCPLTGDHDGAVSDRFLEAGAQAPLTGLPRFVTTRGGDYFFAPGIEAIRKIANGERFAPKPCDVPSGGFSLGDATTPGLFDFDRLQRYGQAILNDDRKRVIHIELPVSNNPEDRAIRKLCFVARYEDVKTVLNNLDEHDDLAFSVRQYTLNGRQITRGLDLIVGTEDVAPTKSTRDRLHAILNKAWGALAAAHDADGISDVVRSVAKSAANDALRRTAHRRRIDLLNDLSAPATFAIITKLYGIAPPDWLTELAASLRFAHRHIGELPPDWLAALINKAPDNPGLTTMQIWSALILADLIGNLQSASALHVLARQAGSEMLNYLDSVIDNARSSRIRSAKTLLGAFVQNEKSPDIEELYGDSSGCDWTSLYYRDVSAILLEIVGTTMASTPLAFTAVMEYLLKWRLDLPTLLQDSDDDRVSQIIYEAERLNPTLPARMRYCEKDRKFGHHKIKKGEWVVSLIKAANLDPRVFEEPLRFKLGRDIKKYLMFNDKANRRQCWGRDRVAMVVLRECVRAAGRLQGLRRVAGRGGEPPKFAGLITTNLPARFTRVTFRTPQASSQATSEDMSQATTPE